GRGDRDGGSDPAGGRGDQALAYASTGGSRHGDGAGGAKVVSGDVGAGEPGDGELHAPCPQAAKTGIRLRLFPVAEAEGAGKTAGRFSKRRRAADGGLGKGLDSPTSGTAVG